MGATTNIAAFRARRHRRVGGGLVLSCALALFATGCAGIANLLHGVEGATAALPAAQASDGNLAGPRDDAIEVKALLPLEPKAAGVEAATTASGRRTAAIMAELALAELSDEKLDDMRGGIVFNAGIVIEFTIDFVARINGDVVDPALHFNGDVVDPALFDDPLNFSGIITQVVDGEATVIGTNDFTGIISLVQNSLDFQDIQNATIVHVDIYGVLMSIRGSLFRSQLNFGAAAGL